MKIFLRNEFGVENGHKFRKLSISRINYLHFKYFLIN